TFRTIRRCPDRVAAAIAGTRSAIAPENRRSTGPQVIRVRATGNRRPRGNEPGNNPAPPVVRGTWEHPGGDSVGAISVMNQPSQVNGSASGRDNIGPDLLQGYSVTSFGGPD